MAGALALSTPAFAVDGVIEINQARAKAGGVTPTDTPLFPVTLDHPGSYRLTSNLDVTDASARPSGTSAENTTAIRVSADDVTIDLNGFAILGPVVCFTSPFNCTSTGSGQGIAGSSPPHINTTVVNGTVRGMGSDGVFLAAGARVENVHVSSNGAGPTGLGQGITTDEGSLIKGNTVDRNGGFAGIGASGTISGNSVFSNGGFGITPGDGSTVLGNTVRDNVKEGLAFGNAPAGYGNNVLTGNNGGEDAPLHPQTSGNGIQIGTNLCGTDTTCP